MDINDILNAISAPQAYASALEVLEWLDPANTPIHAHAKAIEVERALVACGYEIPAEIEGLIKAILMEASQS